MRNFNIPDEFLDLGRMAGGFSISAALAAVEALTRLRCADVVDKVTAVDSEELRQHEPKFLKLAARTSEPKLRQYVDPKAPSA